MKKRLFFDMDGVLVNFESGLKQIDKETKQKYEGHEDDIPGLFGLMKPLDGADEAVHKLSEKYDVFILSTAPWKNPSAWSDKVKWVTRYFDDIFHKKMVITHRKDLCQGDYLIDDRGKNGTSEFGGEWIHFGSARFPDWTSVLAYLLSENQFEKAEKLAREAHRGQKDKSGEDYIEHPLRVSERCKSEKAKIAGLLHDTIEDTCVTPQLLKEKGFDDDIVEAVLALSRRPDETYAEFIVRVSRNEIAKEVKIADLEDNMDVRRLPELTEKDSKRVRKYLHSWRYLKGLETDTDLICEQ